MEYTLPDDAESARWARRLTTAFLTDRRAPAGAREQLDDARLIVSELVANAAEHGHSACRLRLRVDQGELTVEVQDDSPLPPRTGKLSLWAESGRGLAMVRLLASRFAVTGDRDGGKTVRAVLAVC
ncbi:hypothetical protein A6A06_39380 [Streptomyces sp. CB02923]|uniref:ATP-binding protein n=1 Tax=Streptomyces sp. CB02923 TaxID=1718985 RepID=UPI00093E22C4|nr:ATP-binding protein [Streptomyces sp. CB02923]OKI03408.1 hypothetical protein A6A06_39380 [Streptomyces sp. CB02923]